MWECVSQEPVARKSGGAYGAFDRLRLALDLDQHIHCGIPLDSHHRAGHPVLRDLTIDAQDDLVAKALEDDACGLRLRDLRLVLLAMLIAVADADRPFPPQDAEGRRTGLRAKYAQPQHLVVPFELALAIVAPVDHLAAKHELAARFHDRGFERGRIVHARFQLELVRGLLRGEFHENSASSTACVSPRSAKTWVAPAARSAGTSEKPVATPPEPAPI